jgi:hypothetical protein
VSAMRAEYRIIRPQMGADADGDRFLTDVGMASAVNQAALMRLRQHLLTLANELHPTIQAREEVEFAFAAGRKGHDDSLPF